MNDETDSSYCFDEVASWLDFQRRLQAALDNLPPALDAEPSSTPPEARDA